MAVNRNAQVQSATHTVVIGKDSRRELRAIDEQLDSLASVMNTSGRQKRGWVIDYQAQSDSRRYTQTGYPGQWVYRVTVTVTGPATDATEYKNIVQTLLQRIELPQYGAFTLISVDGEVPDTKTQALRDSDDVPYAPCDIPDNWFEHFDHLYGLEPHIERVRRAIDAATQSQWQHRFHCALIGEPGCGKSDICQSIKAAIGEDSVLEFDATSTTMAGAQKELSERVELPRIILVEEIEKAPENSLTWLLSVLDIRANVKRVTARGKMASDAKMLAVATVNDVALFQRMMSGALASRFSNTIYFQRPSRDVLQKILVREVTKVSGNMDWVDATLDYCLGPVSKPLGAASITDPRMVIATCMCGRDALLDGSYQKMMKATAAPKYSYK